MFYPYPFSHKDLLIIAGPVPASSISKDDINNKEIILIEPYIRSFGKKKNILSIFVKQCSKSKIEYHTSNGVNALTYFHLSDDKNIDKTKSLGMGAIARKQFGSVGEIDPKGELFANALRFIAMNNPSSVTIYGLANSKFADKDIEKIRKSIGLIKNIEFKASGDDAFIKALLSKDSITKTPSESKVLNNVVIHEPAISKLKKPNGVVFQSNMGYNLIAGYNLPEDYGVDRSSWYYQSKFANNHAKNLNVIFQNMSEKEMKKLSDINISKFDELFYQKLGIDHKPKDYVLILLNPTTDGLAAVVGAKQDKECDLLCLRGDASFGTAIFDVKIESQKKEQEEAYMLGYALNLYPLKQYKKFVFYHGDLPNPSLNLSSLKELESVESVKSYDYDSLKDLYPARIWNIINARKFTFVEKFGRVFPATRIGIDFDTILANPNNPKIKEFLIKVVALYNNGFEISMICSRKDEEEVLKILGKKIYHHFFRNARVPDENGKLSLVSDIVISIDDF